MNRKVLTLERCIYQLYRPPGEYSITLQEHGWGDCRTCTYDYTNANCAGYKPVTIDVYDYELRGVR